MTQAADEDDTITTPEKIVAENPSAHEVRSTGINPHPPKGKGWSLYCIYVMRPEWFWYRKKGPGQDGE